jgi:hypothetical protein
MKVHKALGSVLSENLKIYYLSIHPLAVVARQGTFLQSASGLIPCGLPRVIIPAPHQMRDKLQPDTE